MFIVLEGGESCGKTTQILALKDHFESRGQTVVTTREPGGTPFAESLRDLFKIRREGFDEPLPLTELYLVMAARCQHIQKVVLPALAAGHVVLCDRFLDSSLVYQGVLGGVPLATIFQIASPSLGSLKPDCTFVLDLDAETSMKRSQQRFVTLGGPTDRYDDSPLGRLGTLRQGFLDLVKNKVPYPDGVVPLRVLIDASSGKDKVTQSIIEAIPKVYV